MKIFYLIRQFHRGEEGTALTELAITLPIFLLLLTGLLHLGNLGQVTVAVKNVAYQEMWRDANEKTQGSSLAHVSPRGQLLEMTPDHNGFTPVSMINSVSNGVGGLGGHWGEARMYTELGAALSLGGVNYRNSDTTAATRLNNNMPGYLNMTSSIIGTGNHRPKFALDDNLADSEQNLMENFSGQSGISGMISGGLASLLEISGIGPGMLAGIRYGDGQGSASAEVDLQNRLLQHTASYSFTYSTALSPLAGTQAIIPGVVDASFGDIGREQYQWFFYYLTGQTISNFRVSLDVAEQDFDGNDSFSPADRYE